MNIADSLDIGAKNFPQRTALIFESKEFSYQQLNDFTNKMANVLRQMGIKVGDRVAILMPNIPAFVIAYHGIQKAGAIAVTLNVSLKQEEIGFILEDSGACVLITTEELSRRVTLKGIPSLQEILIAETNSDAQAPFFLRLSGQSPHADTCDLAPDSPSTLLYTSGTTAFPKGALLSHANVCDNMRPIIERLRIHGNERILLFVPLYHCFGLHVALNTSLWAGATIVLQRQFVLEATRSLIQSQRVNLIFGVPTIYTLLLEHADSEVLASVRASFSAAAPLPKDLAQRWRGHFGSHLYQIYGLSEVPPLVCTNYPNPDKPDSIGSPIDGMEMLIIDSETGKPLAPGESGEIVIQGPGVMSGYWQRPEITAEVIRNNRFHTGDLGYMDTDGDFYIRDRLRDTINVGGFKVFPTEVEAVLMDFPEIKDAAVFGVQDDVMGERVHAAVQVEEDAPVDTEALLQYCRRHLAYFKLPRQVQVVNRIPRNPSGKVLRRVLREASLPDKNTMVTDSDDQNRSEPIRTGTIDAKKEIPLPDGFVEEMKQIPLERQRDYLMAHIRSEINRVCGFDPSQPMDLHKGFFDLGMDSLAAMEIRERLQSDLGHRLPTTLVFKYSSLSMLTGYIASEVLAPEFPKELSLDSKRTVEPSQEDLNRVKQLSEKELEKLIDKKLRISD
ncbi:MAG: AMP-binding protein [Candidatus Thiosymbion ectosymbiont of Robbea hypermnestra]|nr:AMP-binding protein [Candidatus Thiosymbion ectosymbiont of Robbea hypermnestra]